MNKDSTDPGAYRPISITNKNAKIFIAILGKRMSDINTKYILKG